jgi:hypothetical protein
MAVCPDCGGRPAFDGTVTAASMGHRCDSCWRNLGQGPTDRSGRIDESPRTRTRPWWILIVALVALSSVGPALVRLIF